MSDTGMNDDPNWEGSFTTNDLRERDEYKIVIEFTRFHSDDDHILREKGLEVTPENLKKQIAAELQEAYDHGFLAGFFFVREE